MCRGSSLRYFIRTVSGPSLGPRVSSRLSDFGSVKILWASYDPETRVVAPRGIRSTCGIKNPVSPITELARKTS